MNGCYLNASLTDESLQVKLSLICKAVNATYEIMDTHIIVYGRGCGEWIDYLLDIKTKAQEHEEDISH